MPNFIEINHAVEHHEPKDTDWWSFVLEFSVYAGMDHRRSAVVVRCKNITILGSHYSDTNSPYNPKISRSVASYIAARRDLARNLHCYKLPCYVPAKLASWPCRTWNEWPWKLNLHCRAHSNWSVQCSKRFHPIYITFSQHLNKHVVGALAKYHRNWVNPACSFLCLRKRP